MCVKKEEAKGAEDAMLARVIHDLYYLKRIHSVVLDEKLGHALKMKLSALDLRTGPSPGPSALRRLLECLVYFQLEQSLVTSNAVALVREELPRMAGSQLSRTIAACCTLGQHDVSVSAVPLLAEALPTMDSTGIVQLIQSLAAANVRHEDTWSLLAEHCIRRIDSLTGQQLYRVIECFYERKVHYPDFYVVAERHICAQPSSYISMEHLSCVIECYRGLGLPIMSLLAASSTRSTEGFDSGLVAVAPARARREQRGDVSGLFTATAADGSSSNHGLFAAFVQSTLKAIKAADDSQLRDMLQKCEAKKVMHGEIMEAMAVRLHELYTESPDVARTTALMRLMLRFEKHEWFVGAARPLSQLLDECGEGAIPALGHRMLNLADAALRLFPSDVQPTRFYTVLVRDLKIDDVAASIDARRLPLLASVMVSLRAYGGVALLEQHMPMISVAAANAPLRAQVEMAAMLAPIPAARKVFLPDLFNSLSSQKSLTRRITAREVILLLDGLARSRLPYNDLLLVVVEYTKKNLGRFDAPELVNILLQSATLGFNDIEFYSLTATYILEKASNSTVHDLCMLMYVFTFMLKGVIRVVQQMLPRLRVSASHASTRDITLVLYSTVKLGISRHAEVTNPFCDRAVNILSSFKGEELASCMSSLRALRHDHDGFLSASAQVLISQLARREGRLTVTANAHDLGIALNDAQVISIASAILKLRRGLLHGDCQSTLQRISFSSLTSAGATQTHLIAITVAALDEVPCTTEQWERLHERANSVCDRFQSGITAAEVLLALSDLITRDGGDDEKVRDALAGSPLLAYAQSNMATIVANTELRDTLRSKGLLTLLAGVSASFTTEDADHFASSEVPLRDSLLWHYKVMRRAGAPTRTARSTSRALKPTSTPTAPTTMLMTPSTPIPKKKSKTSQKQKTMRKGASEKDGVRSSTQSPLHFHEKRGATVADTEKNCCSSRDAIEFGVESQADVEEFLI